MSKQNPDHYKLPGGVQLIDVTKHCSFPVGNAMKYIFRAGRKPGESSLDDLLKAKWFVDLMIQEAIDQKAKRIVGADKQAEECQAAGRPLKPCGDCPASGSCMVEKVAQQPPESPYEADDQIQLHSSVTEVPEAITRAGVRRKIL
tara:strand:- start:500 stop:934 length:435 start_codon:yes stop_codon:yes gene_type:complete